jgi:hypothetical protein
METVGVLYGLVSPTLGFHVVRKSVEQPLPSAARPAFAD